MRDKSSFIVQTAATFLGTLLALGAAGVVGAYYARMVADDVAAWAEDALAESVPGGGLMSSLLGGEGGGAGLFGGMLGGMEGAGAQMSTADEMFDDEDDWRVDFDEEETDDEE